MKITGQSLNGNKSTLKPVNKEISDKLFSIMNDSQYMTYDTWWVESIYVAHATTAPINIRDAPSITHSINMILLLSTEISPNPLMTDLVGKR